MIFGEADVGRYCVCSGVSRALRDAHIIDCALLFVPRDDMFHVRRVSCARRREMEEDITRARRRARTAMNRCAARALLRAPSLRLKIAAFSCADIHAGDMFA